MKSTYIPERDLEALRAVLSAYTSEERFQAILVWACDDNAYDVNQLSALLRTLPKTVFGGTYPALLYNGHKKAFGTLVIGIEKAVRSAVFKNISQNEESVCEQLRAFSKGLTYNRTVLLAFDGLSGGVDWFKEQLFDEMGLVFNYLGGGAGSLSFEQKPCVYTNEGVLEDAAALLYIDSLSGIGVAHGWHPITEEIKVSRADQNTVYELNGKPALEVYSDKIERISNILVTPDNFFDVAKAFPFGIAKMSQEMIVRDPIAVGTDGSIKCIAQVPQNVFVHILNGSNRSLINGAIQARKNAADDFYKKKGFDGTSGRCFAMVVDCVSRALFLGDAYDAEIKALSDGVPVIGLLSLGEIANTGRAYLELYNKTVVVSYLEV